MVLPYISYAQAPECDYKIDIIVDDEEFTVEEFVWRMRAIKVDGIPTNITGRAEIIDLNDKIIKKYKPWTNRSISKQKTSSKYSPNLKTGEYKIISKIYVECDDTNKDNNIDIQTIKIIEEKIENEQGRIENIEPTQPKTEEESKEENKTEINEENKLDTTNEIDNPQLINEENNNKEIPVATKEVETNEASENEEFENIIHLRTENNQKNPNQATGAAVKESEFVYESSNERAKDLIILFLLVLSVLLNMILIWRR
ncbi:hypothetical protein CMO83_02435 [Candidatus Woesearchaeota archaeon]|nr:hypothetical protein [Candidatus Woesearchaeota archaeon]